jgi:hypothetical protein
MERRTKHISRTGKKIRTIKVTKEYFETEDEKVYFFEPLEKEILVDDLQKIVDANEKLVKELKGADR